MELIAQLRADSCADNEPDRAACDSTNYSTDAESDAFPLGCGALGQGRRRNQAGKNSNSKIFVTHCHFLHVSGHPCGRQQSQLQGINGGVRSLWNGRMPINCGELCFAQKIHWRNRSKTCIYMQNHFRWSLKNQWCPFEMTAFAAVIQPR